MENIIVVGCGYAGAVVARLAAENGYSVTVLEKRGQIAGNMFDLSLIHISQGSGYFCVF